MKQVSYFVSLIGISLLFASCDGGGSFLSASSTANEVLVVMAENDWNDGMAGRALFDVLNSPVAGLPQTEPNFRILQVTPENFTSTFKMTRNVVIPEISNIYSAPKLSSELDKYAYGQVVMTIKAPDTLTFVNYVIQNKEKIIDYLVNKELERTAEWLTKDASSPQAEIRKNFGISMFYPKGLPTITTEQDFYWATNNAGERRQDIVIYQFPYTNENVFEKDSLIAIQNRVLGQHIKGAHNSQMAISKMYDPFYKKMDVDGIFRAELRGLWEMTTDMMGGPFVSQAFVNPNTNKVIVATVFVYAPEGKKRNLIRNLEASFYTIKILDPNTTAEKK
ncbi:MAG: DUF4837 family protein [Petrimonas sp.]|nr:DUF4837 family protein [Petrimonas sp.]